MPFRFPARTIPGFPAQALPAVRLKTIHCFVLTLIAVGGWFPVAQSSYAAEDEGELDVLQHTIDGVYLDFAPFGVIELPRIFLAKRESGAWALHAFPSTRSALRSGRYALLHEGANDHAKPATGEAPPYAGAGSHAGQATDEALLEEAIAHHDHLYATLEPVDGTILVDLSITRHLAFGILAALIVLAIFVTLARRYKKGVGRTSAPRGVFQNAFEVLVLYVRDEVVRPTIPHKHKRFLPFLLTAFFFILCCNLMGLVPYAGAATSNFSITFVLATYTFVAGVIFASKAYWKHLFWPPGIPHALKILLVPVEILGVFTKHFALAIRLFANMMAGTLVILTLIGLIFTINELFGGIMAASMAPVSIAFTLFILVLKLAVAFIQAFVFTLLSSLFIGMAVEEGEHHADAQPVHSP